MTSIVQPIQFIRADQSDETARADLYGLLAGLFAAPPQLALLRAIASAPMGGDSLLEQAWHALMRAADQALQSPARDAVREEYERLFVGIGKPEVMLYGSFYLSGFLMEKPLVALRTDLALLGLERADAVVESEDHVASLCEVMRYLITADDADDADPDAAPASAQASLAAQKDFFYGHMHPWVGTMCNAIAAHPQSRFYRAVAALAGQFFEVEAQAFDMT